jgi:hypothetical protein
MLKHPPTWTIVLAALLVVFPFLLWGGYAAVAVLQGQHFFRGLPSSYWARRVRRLSDAALQGNLPPPAWWEAHLPSGVVAALADFGIGDRVSLLWNAAAIPVLLDLLKDPDEQIRWLAARALGWTGCPVKEARSALVDALRDRSEKVREEAGWALSGTNTGINELAAGEIMPAVRFLAGREDWRPLVALAPQWVGKAEAPSLLDRALRHPNPQIRRNTLVWGLWSPWMQRVRDPARLLPALREASRDPDDSVRKAAGEALEGVEQMEERLNNSKP